MVDFDRLSVRFRQFGGFRLAWEYVRLGLLWIIIKELCRCVIHRKSFKTIYPAIGKVVDPMLINRYRHITGEYKDATFEHKDQSNTNINGKTYVWSCWLQGWGNAPELAKACLSSLKRNITNAEVVEIDAVNFSNWVSLPEYIVEKYKSGRIPSAMFSDMLRLELLAEHGGVWIDSTVLYTKTDNSEDDNKHINERGYSPTWEEIVNAELFVFQYTKPGHRYSGSISNWFIASEKGNPFVMTLRDMLFAYWKDYDVALEYYICHLFFNEVAKVYPEQIAKMPYGWSMPCITLGGHLEERFNERKWMHFTSQVKWHKMTYRHTEKAKAIVDSYYNHILKDYLG